MITVVGIGPGSPDFLFEQGKAAIEAAELIIGSRRQLAILPVHKQTAAQLLPQGLQNLESVLREHLSTTVVLLASGDPLTYGIGKWVRQHFTADEVTILPGISSIQYLFNKAGLPLENCFFSSSHGKVPDYDLLFRLPKVGLVTDQQIGPYELAQEAVKRGVKKYFLIGENLSYPEERLRWYSAETVPQEAYQMNVVVIVDER